MITPLHLTASSLSYLLIIKIGGIQFHFLNLIFLYAAELIDLDHLFSKPIYHPGRNPFKTHFLHKNWRIIIILAFAFILKRTTMFLGLGLFLHLLLDYIEVAIKKLLKL